MFKMDYYQLFCGLTVILGICLVIYAKIEG